MITGIRPPTFEEKLRKSLRLLGFEIQREHFSVPDLGLEIDLELGTPKGGVVWVEAKNSWSSVPNTVGLSTTRAVRQALCGALLLHAHQGQWPRMIIIASQMPPQGSAGDHILASAIKAGAVFAAIDPDDPEGRQTLGALLRFAPD